MSAMGSQPVQTGPWSSKKTASAQATAGRWNSIQRFGPIRLLIQTATEWYEDNALEHGAALAYYAAFSISPVVLLSIAVASTFLGQDAAEGRITEQIQTAVGPTVAGAIQGTLAHTYRTGSGTLATIVGIAALIFAAMGFFGQLQSALNTIWNVRPKSRQGIWATLVSRFFSFLEVVVACLLILASLLASAVLSTVASILPASRLPGGINLWQGLTLSGFLVILIVAFALLFQYLPDAKIRWRDVWIGAATSAALFILGNYAISLYLRLSGTTSAYGAAGSFVVILLWAYYSGLILLFGAEFTQVYAKHRGHPIQPTEGAEAIS